MTQETESSLGDSSAADRTAHATDDNKQGNARSAADMTVQIRRVLTVLASAARLLATVFAAILVVHIVLSVSGANPTNGVRRFFQGGADGLTLGLGDLFVSQGVNLQIVLNYGVPAVAWLIIGFVLARVLRALTP